MENEVQSNNLPTQPLSQIPPVVLPPTNWSKKIIFVSLGLVVIASSLFIGFQIGKKQTPCQQSVVVLPTSSHTQTNQTTIIGVIRTSGLSEDEKQNLDLPDVVYQITDFNRDGKQEINGYYLISRDKSLETLLGKCVQMIGTEPTEWKSKNKSDPYLRAALIPDSIDLLESSKCSPYSTIPSENIAGSEKLTLKGIVKNSNRPAPDISYDYKIELSKPFLDENSPSGSPQEVSLVEAVPDTNDVWIKLANSINQEVEIQGYMQWGYAESKYFKITSILKVQ